jgi:hypothetical protein
MSFANLKRNRPDLSQLVATAKEATGTTQKRESDDPRMWQPTRDKAGNGYAVVRFLPGKDTEGTPWVRYWDHAFKGPTGQWYIEKSLTSIGQQDPLSELNSKMWNSGMESDKTTVRQRKRNLRYFANILVVSDPANPANEGKVFLYRFGKKIFDKLMDSMQPQFPDEKPVNPFDMWEGADFTIKIRKVEGYPNYDASSFKAPSPVSTDDAQLEDLYNQQHDMSDWIDPKNYKSYDDLQKRLSLVLGETTPRSAQGRVNSAVELDDEIPEFKPREASAPEQREPWTDAHQSLEESVGVGTRAPDDDDIMAKFAMLANDD